MEKKYPPSESRLIELREAGKYPHSRPLLRIVSFGCLLLGASLWLQGFSITSIELKDAFYFLSVVAGAAFLICFSTSSLLALLQSRFSVGRKRFSGHRDLNGVSFLFLVSAFLIFAYSIFAFFDGINSYRVLKYCAAALVLNCVLLSVLDYFISRLSFNRKNAMSKEEILAEDG